MDKLKSYDNLSEFLMNEIRFSAIEFVSARVLVYIIFSLEKYYLNDLGVNIKDREFEGVINKLFQMYKKYLCGFFTLDLKVICKIYNVNDH